MHLRAALLLAAVCLRAGVAQAAPPVEVMVGSSPLNVAVESQKDVRFGATIRQQYDFSCGSAAVATLLTFHYGMPTTEQQAFEAMYASGDQRKIRSEGFSLLDMKRFLASRGFEADGFELPLEKLSEARIPAIVLITENGYHHFVVVKGLREGRVLLGDPTKGGRLLSRRQFDAVWQNRLLFVVHNQQDLASFNALAEWRSLPRAPLASGVVRDPMSSAVPPRMGPHEL